MSNYIYGPVFGIHNDFVKVPEALHYLPKYSSMSCAAKWLYCTLADMHFRTKVSDKYDSRGYACVRISGNAMAEAINCKVQKARKALKELTAVGLVAVAKSEGNKNRIYFLDYTKDKDYMDYKTFLKSQSGSAASYVKNTDLDIDPEAEWPEEDEAENEKSERINAPAAVSEQAENETSPKKQPVDKTDTSTIILKK